jgi:apolipoprotein N-acyltransferase
LIVAGVAGVVLALGFPPVGLWPLLPPAVAGITLACTGASARAGALAGFVAGLGFFLPLLQWMRVVGVDAWVGLSVLQALFWVGLGAALAVVARVPGWPLWAAGCWVLVEAARSVMPWGGFPWGRLAYGMVDSPLVGVVSLGGVAMLTAVTAAAGALAAAAVVALHRRDRTRALGALALTAGLLLVGPLCTALITPPAPERSITAAVVQGNVPRLGLDFFGQREAVLSNHVEATEALADDVAAGVVPAPDVVVWPENSTDIDPFADDRVGRRISAAVASVGQPTLVGALVGTSDGTQVENSAIVWDPITGPGERYVKRHPVPFGEYIPGRQQLASLIGRLDRIPRDMVAGSQPGVLTVGPATLGVVICFEIAYDAEVRDTVTNGGEAIVVQTNNATYGRTGQPDQQFAISRLRAIEHQRDVLIASTSGISGIIRADGSVAAVTDEFVQRVLVDQVGLRTSLAWATRAGPAVAWTLALTGVAGIVAGVVIGIVARRSTDRQKEPA